MKMMAGALSLAWLKRSRTREGADADEHLDEVRARDRVEGNARLAGDGAGEERLARSGRAVQQHALRDARTDVLELRRVLQEVLDLLHLFDRLVGAGDIAEGDRRRLLRHELRSRLAELHDLAAAALGARQEEPEEETQQQDRQEERDEAVEPGRTRDGVVEALARRGGVDRLDDLVGASLHVVELHVVEPS